MVTGRFWLLGGVNWLVNEWNHCQVTVVPPGRPQISFTLSTLKLNVWRQHILRLSAGSPHLCTGNPNLPPQANYQTDAARPDSVLATAGEDEGRSVELVRPFRGTLPLNINTILPRRTIIRSLSENRRSSGCRTHTCNHGNTSGDAMTVLIPHLQPAIVMLKKELQIQWSITSSFMLSRRGKVHSVVTSPSPLATFDPKIWRCLKLKYKNSSLVSGLHHQCCRHKQPSI